MDTSFFGNIGAALGMLADVRLLVVMVVAGAYGLFVGAIPGLTATMATALLVPFAFFMDPLPALAAIVTMSAMAIFAGDIPSALVRMPGTPSSAAYVEDAYQLSRRGQAATVLGTSILVSVIGGIFGSVVLMLGAPILAEIAFKFTSFEYFWLALLGLSAAVIISSESPLKGGISLVIGLLLSTIGLDITLGYPRFTFGSIDLLGGISFIPAMIGLFGLSEVLRNVMGAQLELATGSFDVKGMFSKARGVIGRYRREIPRSAVIGTGIGILPGAGADIAAWVSYAASKNASKEAEKYGTGHIQGIVAASTANNASLAGAWVPALVFGIPGDTITAITIGVLFMKGMRPGPQIFEEHAPLVYALYLVFILANLLMVPLGYLAVRFSGTMLRVPRNILMPVILIFCIVGSYAINNSLFDVAVMIVMGILGYFLEGNGFPVAPIVLGIVLGPIVEKNFMFSVIKTNWHFGEFFTRPISALLVVVCLLTWGYALLRPFLARRRAAAGAKVGA